MGVQLPNAAFPRLLHHLARQHCARSLSTIRQASCTHDHDSHRRMPSGRGSNSNSQRGGARAAAADARYDLVRNRWLLAACIFEFVTGLALMVLAYHVTGEDFGQALFAGGLIVGDLGPVWTWILASWRGGE